MAKVFISYSHKDKAWKDLVMTHLEVLEKGGPLQLWNDRDIELGADWFREIETALNEAEVVILVITANFLSSPFILGEEVPRILERRKKEDLFVAPLIVRDCAWKRIQWLSRIQVMPNDGKPLYSLQEHEIDSVLAELTGKIFDLFDSGKKSLTGQEVQPFLEDKISLFRLPTTGKDLFGRDDELKLLDDAWDDANTHILTFVAWGGVGKTALVNEWLSRMGKDNYRGAKKIYGWSFYSQGATEGKQASADEFFQETLAWFGDRQPEAGSAVDKGRRLAALVRNQKTLLVLDGLEPLQYPPGEIRGAGGQLKDHGMRMFLKALSNSNNGLCIVSTREELADLENMKKHSVKEVSLERLSTSAGVNLLKSLGVSKGTAQDFDKTVEEYEGHALALTLLSRYIKVVCGGNIRKRDKITKLFEGRISEAHHAKHVMTAYEHWLGASPRRDILYIMGLFDRPAEKNAVDALKNKPAIPGVTEKLQQISERDWQFALEDLRDVHLLAKENPQKPGTLDCHPLVREHFGDTLQNENPNGWKAAHERLYEYYKEKPDKYQPESLHEMDPLFSAISHGCRAGLHKQALIDVFWKRIRRKDKAYSISKLGSIGADLEALSHFFETPWSQPKEGLQDGDIATLYKLAGLDLRAMGRSQEALQLMEAASEFHIKQNDFRLSAIDTRNISELLLTMGDINKAAEYAQKSVSLADKSRDNYWKVASKTAYAYILCHCGKQSAAEKYFLQAKSMQSNWQPAFKLLYSIPGYQFCNFLLETGDYVQVIEQAEQTLKDARQFGNIFDVALDNLSLGRAYILKAVKEKGDSLKIAIDYLNSAEQSLLAAGREDYLPPALLARAECYRLLKDYENAWADLNEAEEIAELGSMKLHLCDYHLEAGRLRRDEGKKKKTMTHFNTAAKMIRKMGYWRRYKEMLLEETYGCFESNQAADKIIEDIQQAGSFREKKINL